MKKNILILSFTLLVVMLGYGLVMPIIPFLIQNLGAGGSEMGWLMSSYALMQLIFAPLWGALSDRIGRKPVLALGVLGYALALLLFGLSTELWMLFAARILSGILSSATMPTAMAYIGDNVPENERSGGMGQLGAAMGIGVVVGPLVGGLISEKSLSLPFFIGSGMALAAFLLVILILPASTAVQPAAPQKARLQRSTVWSTLAGPAGILLLLTLVISFGLANFQGIIGLYVVEKFATTTRQVGLIWMVVGGIMILAQGVLIKPLTRAMGEQSLIRWGLAAGAVGLAGIAIARSYPVLLLTLAFFALAVALVGPALNAMISAVAGERQGATMGLSSAATSLGRVIGPVWAGYLYDVNIEYPYFSGAVVLGLGALACVWLFRKKTSPVVIPVE